MADGGMADDGAPVERVSVAELDRERLVSYVRWGEVDVPWWYWPVYGAALAAWIAAYHLGFLIGTVTAVAFAAAMGMLASVVTARSGVSTPRLRGMPAPLRRTFVPILAVGVLSLAAAGLTLVMAEGPALLILGPVVGVAMALAGWCHVRWYRRESRRLAAASGIDV
jgi:hypothetical protein